MLKSEVFLEIYGGVWLILRFCEERGTLSKIILSDIPFPIHELFVVSGVPVGMVRGNHAHKVLHQYLICLEGKVRVALTYKSREESEVTLTSDDQGIHIPPNTWASQTYLTEESRLLVFTSGEHKPDEYFRSLEAFYEEVVEGYSRPQ